MRYHAYWKYKGSSGPAVKGRPLDVIFRGSANTGHWGAAVNGSFVPHTGSWTEDIDNNIKGEFDG